MKINRLLIANRGEVAVRVIRTASEMGVATVAVYSPDDARCLHVAMADESRALKGAGAAAYLDIAQIIRVARDSGCDAIHPGWGFLSENPELARRCQSEGIVFVGPRPETLVALGDKTRAREIAAGLGVPLLRGSDGPVTVEQARAFLAGLGPGGSMVIKAVAGGGGRGMRVVDDAAEVEALYARCQSEALRAFGNGDLYVEERMARARHVEVQVVGDGTGAVSHLWERDCSIQRRHQKLVEIAPSPVLSPELRAKLTADAVRMAASLDYKGVGTFEFLVDADGAGNPDGHYAFIEANPRLQVEHTVTEEILGLDLVRAQLRIAAGETLAALGLDQAHVPAPRGSAIQLRVNMEEVQPDGEVRPSTGTLAVFQPPSGPGVRTDTFGYAGYAVSPSFDSLLAKVIVHAPSGAFDDTVARASRALHEFRLAGVGSNLSFLRNLLEHPGFRKGEAHTTFVDEHIADLSRARDDVAKSGPPVELSGHTAGAKLDSTDPLAVLDFGKQASIARQATSVEQPAAAPDGMAAVTAPMQGTIVAVTVSVGDLVRKGQQLLVMEAMKMEHVIRATTSGIVWRVNVAPGDTIYERHPLVFIEEREFAGSAAADEASVDPDYIRPDLAEVMARHAATLDAARPEAVARRRKTGQRTARENVDDLCDPGTFKEHGNLVLTPGTGLPLDEVVRRFPTDGMVTGIGSVNQALFGPDHSRCVVMSYDYTVLAGTQGAINHPKTDRMLELAEKWMLPVLFFTEGGGGRAGTGGRREGGQAVSNAADIGGGRFLDTPTFASMGRLSGLVPLIGINSGRCFAGNAALLGCCDVIIATADSNIGMGGPAMIEGGGLGVFAPEEVGPMDVQVPNGVVDIAVADEAEAVRVARQYLSYFQGAVEQWECADQRALRHALPENRLRMYDVREVIDTLCDARSVLELRRHFGLGMVTAFGRVEGRPLGIVANNPAHLAGAIDSDGADKAARFMQLCDAFDIPLLVLCDTPGMMVGPEVEKTALVRHCSRMFVTGANLSIPHFTVVLRKAYGLGAQAMAGGSFKEPTFAVAWPTGEFGGMGLEGQIKLGFRNELAAIEDSEQRLARFNELVERAYQRGKALSYAVSFGVDDVIDPSETRGWLVNGLRSVPAPLPRREKKRRNIDTW